LKLERERKKKVFKGFHLSIFEEDRRDHPEWELLFSFLPSIFLSS
jgi:hypothetical protein